MFSFSLLFFCFPTFSESDHALKVVTGEGEKLASLASTGWTREELVALDRVGDVTGGRNGADLLAFYRGEYSDEVRFRVSFVQMVNPATGEDMFRRDRVSIVILMDYSDGGRVDLPFGINGSSRIEWDDAVVVDPFRGTSGSVDRLNASTDLSPSTQFVDAAFVDRRGEYIAVSMPASREMPPF